MKAKAIKFYKLGKNETVLDGRISLGLGESEFGIDYRFIKIEIMEFVLGIESNTNMFAIKTKSGKFREVNKNNLNNFIL